MLVYMLIFGYFLLLKKVKNNLWYFIPLLLITILRYDIGWDYRWYYRLAEGYKLYSLPLFINKEKIFHYVNQFDIRVFQYYTIELFNRILYKISWYFEMKPQFIILVYGILMLSFIKKGLDKEQQVYVNKNSWLLFFACPLFYLNFLSIMRQGVAVSLFFYSYTYIKQRKFIKYISLIVLASFFHKTVLIMLPVYFFYNIKINKKLYLMMLIIGIFFDKIFLKVVLEYNIPIISRYKTYVINSIGEGGTKLFYVILLIGIVILFLIFIDKKFYKKNIFFIFMTLSGVFIYCSLISLGHLGPRMSIYFFIYILYLIPEIEKSLKKMGISKYLISIFILVVLILQLYSDKNNIIRSQFVPYKTIFSEKVNF